MKKIVYFDCFSGISGDMTLGAFLDAGVDPQILIQSLDALNVPGFHLEIEKTQKHGISGTQCHVVLDKHEHVHRHLRDIKNILDASSLDDGVKATALQIFEVIAEAEAKVHGCTKEEIHFHEVGALDSIADIVGAAVCLHEIGAQAVYCSAVNTGKGFVRCAHGVMPVPAPATAAIMAQADIPIYSRFIDGEAVTPTGAAILCCTAEYADQIPKMTVESIGYGFGERDFGILNAVRIFIGRLDGGHHQHHHDHGAEHSHGHEHHEHHHGHEHSHDDVPEK